MSYYEPTDNEIQFCDEFAQRIEKDMEVQITGTDLRVNYSPKKLKVIYALYMSPKTVSQLASSSTVNVQSIRKFVRAFEKQGILDRGDFYYQQGYMYFLNKRQLCNRVSGSFNKPIEKLQDFTYFSSEFNNREVDFNAIVLGGANPSSPARSAITAFSSGLAYAWYRSYTSDEFGEADKAELYKTLESCRSVVLDHCEMMLKVLNHPLWKKEKIHLLLESDADEDLMKGLADVFNNSWKEGRISPQGVHPVNLEHYVEGTIKAMVGEEDDE